MSISLKKLSAFIIPVLLCFLVGFLGSILQSNSLEYWYPYLNKSGLTPPDSVFPIAWSILYLCMGISIGFILVSCGPRKKELITLFIIQLILNFGWSVLFFTMRNPLLGLIDIVLLEIVLVIYTVRSWPVCRIAAWLFVPYILWVAFATYLNLYIYLHN